MFKQLDKNTHNSMLFFFFKNLVSQPKQMLWVLKRNVDELVLLSTQNMCLNSWVRKYSQFCAQEFCLSQPMIVILKTKYLELHCHIMVILNTIGFSRRDLWTSQLNIMNVVVLGKCFKITIFSLSILK